MLDFTTFIIYLSFLSFQTFAHLYQVHFFQSTTTNKDQKPKSLLCGVCIMYTLYSNIVLVTIRDVKALVFQSLSLRDVALH